MAWFPGCIRKEVTRHRTPMARYRGICNHVAATEAAQREGQDEDQRADEPAERRLAEPIDAAADKLIQQPGQRRSEREDVRDSTCAQIGHAGERSDGQADNVS